MEVSGFGEDLDGGVGVGEGGRGGEGAEGGRGVPPLLRDAGDHEDIREQTTNRRAQPPLRGLVEMAAHRKDERKTRT